MLNVPENELFSAYLDGELTVEEQTKMEDLLKTSSGARKLMDELRALSSTLQSLPVVELEEDLSGRVLRAAERKVLSDPVGAERAASTSNDAPSPRPRMLGRVLRGRTLWWSGAAVAVALVLTFVEKNGDSPEPGGTGTVAVNPSISPTGNVPEGSAVEDPLDHHGPMVVSAAKPDEDSAVQRPAVEDPPVDESTNDEPTMIVESDGPIPTPPNVPDSSPKAVGQGDRVLVVKCDIREEDSDGRVLKEILAKRKIARLEKTDAKTGKAYMVVDLTPTQYRNLVAHLKSQEEHFVAVSAPRAPGAAGPRIPIAFGPPEKAPGTGKVGPETPGGNGATDEKKDPAGPDSQTGPRATSDRNRAPEHRGDKRPARQEQKLQVRIELNVVSPAVSESGKKKSDASAKQ